MGNKVHTDGRIIWGGAHADIPSGWTRDTDFDDRFLQGGSSGFTVSANGGSASHDHTANAHGHTGVSHYHNFYAAILDANNTWAKAGSRPQIVYEVMAVPTGHTHVSKATASNTITYVNATPTIVADSTAPPSVRVIVIKPDGSAQHIPDDGICFGDNASVPTGFSVCDGTGGTPDLDEKFLRVADTGDDADFTGEGNANHNHTSSHTHTVNGHNHAQTICGLPNTNANYDTTSPTSTVLRSYHHKLTCYNAYPTLSSDDGNIDNASTEPAYVELYALQNTSGAATTPVGVIVGFVGAEASIPSNWSLVTATTDKQIRCTASSGDLLGTGGSNTHTHTTSNHVHTHSAHNHSSAIVQYSFVDVTNTPLDNQAVTFGALHKHTWTVTDTTATMQNNTFTMSTDDVRLPYRTIIFIKKDEDVAEIMANPIFFNN